ncbi:ribonucleoside-diphosphate reductase [Escherichia coli]|uniref:Ribonucleoside-diphosphate reductase n=1 Tax=Escherichia coli TaxID=562 RepID=A0A2X1NDE9_ECOLX|nr:ribonucleoside-diphosphate reductase [Escherichia coli]
MKISPCSARPTYRGCTTRSSADQEEFERLYTKYEKDDSIRKQRVKAVELFSLMMQERASTGRIYIQNVDHCNTHSPFDPAIAPVRQSNLCLEIALRPNR